MINIRSTIRIFAAVFFTFAVSANNAAPALADDHGGKIQPTEYAVASDMAVQALLLDVARAGSRLVAVGEFGHVLLSDDNGDSWRQAASVPTRNTLVGVSFIDNQTGYAVGHAATILKTVDGGENWALQYVERYGETPLFAVHFADAQNGIAVGGFSYTFETDNGGESWTQRSLVEDSYDDFHLNDVFADTKGNLYIPAEFGTVYKSRDRGQNWQAIETGYDGSFWGLGLSMVMCWSSACAGMFGVRPMPANAGSKSKPAPTNRFPAEPNWTMAASC